MIIIKRKAILFIIVFFMSVFSALRIFGYDRDYLNYQKYYDLAAFGHDTRFEPGFEFFTNLIKVTLGSEGFVLYLFILALVSLSFKFSILSRGRYFLFIVLIYSLLIYPLHEMMQVRIALASGIIFYALYLSINSGLSLLKKILWILLGLSCHYSVLVIAPFVLWPKLFYKRSLLLLMFMALIPALLIFYSIQNVITLDVITEYVPLLVIYLEYEDAPNPISTRMITFVIILILGVLYIKNLPEYSLPWLYMSFLGIGLFYGLISIPPLAHRFLEITIFSYLIWIPNLPKIPRIIALTLLLVFSVYFMYRAFVISPFFGDHIWPCPSFGVNHQWQCSYDRWY